MAKLLIYEPQDFLRLSPLKGIPGVETIDSQSLLGKKLLLHSEAWLRDQILWLEGQAYETLNTRGDQQYLITSFLRDRDIDVLTNRYLPFQGGHILQTGDRIFCSSSCALNQSARRMAFDRGERLKWELESLEHFKQGTSTKFIHDFLPQAIVLPSLKDLPWTYHADLSVALLGDLALVGDPALFSADGLTHNIEQGLGVIEQLLQSCGFKTLRFPLYFDAAKNVFHSPLNGLVIEGCFYYSLIAGMTEFNHFVEDFVARKLPKRASPVILPPAFLGTGGGLRCLSLEL